MTGYYNNEEATREVLDAEGWLHTGDVAYYDDEYYFHIVDRTKELIKVKGHQVGPTPVWDSDPHHPTSPSCLQPLPPFPFSAFI